MASNILATLRFLIVAAAIIFIRNYAVKSFFFTKIREAAIEGNGQRTGLLISGDSEFLHVD